MRMRHQLVDHDFRVELSHSTKIKQKHVSISVVRIRRGHSRSRRTGTEQTKPRDSPLFASWLLLAGLYVPLWRPRIFHPVLTAHKLSRNLPTSHMWTIEQTHITKITPSQKKAISTCVLLSFWAALQRRKTYLAKKPHSRVLHTIARIPYLYRRRGRHFLVLFVIGHGFNLFSSSWLLLLLLMVCSSHHRNGSRSVGCCHRSRSLIGVELNAEGWAGV
jgi:hypothetical protein